jgi:GT2 family glycosyltransferase
LKTFQVSASIVVYKNRPQDVVSAVKSVLDSPLRVRCTVVDNSPNPELQRHVVEIGAKYIFNGRNCGFGTGHNLTLQADAETSEYQLVLNPDVSFGSDVLATLYRFMNDSRDVGLVMPKILYPDGSEQRLCKRLPSPVELISRRFLGRIGKILFANRLRSYELRFLDLTVPREIPCLSGCFMFLRSTTLREIGSFDERYFMYMEDVDLCRRIGLKHKTVFYPEVAVIHGYTKGSYRNVLLLKYHMRSALKYFNKWGWIRDPDRSKLNTKTKVYKPEYHEC